MKKLRIYLDTSVISHLDAPDVPDKMADTLRLWEDIKAGKYDVVISNITAAEIDQTSEEKRTYMKSMLASINSTFVELNREAERIAGLYSEFGGLPPKCKNDALHIAIATVQGCNIVLSWNFGHIVNLRAMAAVEAVNIKEGYANIRLLSPTMILTDDEEVQLHGI